MGDKLKVALVGNPNSGKTSLFNILTGLNQKISNFPGTTVEAKKGSFKLADGTAVVLTDLPGIYSLYPKSLDEIVASEFLIAPHNPQSPDVIISVVDANNLKRNLLLFTQVADLKKPVIMALNMLDLTKDKDYIIDAVKLGAQFGVKVIPINARKGKGIDEIKKAIEERQYKVMPTFYDINPRILSGLTGIKVLTSTKSDYQALQVAHHYKAFKFTDKHRTEIEGILKEAEFNRELQKADEAVKRYEKIDRLLEGAVKRVVKQNPADITEKIDKVLTHRVFGPIIFLAVLTLIFQAIFAWAEYPMELIEKGFSNLSQWLISVMPDTVFTDLLANGVIAGLSGVAIFLPQIALLFGFITIMEDTGYMARVSFITDKLMSKVGLNGKSMVPLISGAACAVPAIMSTRFIENWKDRLITILVTPLMSCSARLPVYVLLISFIVPDEKVLGFFNMQGLILLLMYLLGFVMAMVVAFAFKLILKQTERTFFIMELPVYHAPRLKNIWMTIYQKSGVFLWEAGKVIMIVSLVLWGLASYGPADRMTELTKKYTSEEYLATHTEKEAQSTLQAEKLEASYAGILGKTIEPVIRPLGFDWKIGIALVTSFAAREVFVGTMATIFSVGDGDDASTLKEKMQAQKDPQTGEPKYTAAVALSLMFFYAFAMQCMSTLAVVYRETKGWKWPTVQFLYMTGLAYIASLTVYQLMK